MLLPMLAADGEEGTGTLLAVLLFKQLLLTPLLLPPALLFLLGLLVRGFAAGALCAALRFIFCTNQIQTSKLEPFAEEESNSAKKVE
ncbi:unnamed protein product, partial [Ceratitis capitata]